MLRELCAVLFCLASLPSASQQKPVPLLKPDKPVFSGTARVIDGDTIVIEGTRIRLFGIDAPEIEQTCQDGWKAGQAAFDYLSGMMPRTAYIICTQRSIDQYHRVVALCTRDNIDVAAVMVFEGMAYADSLYSTRYLPEERQAKTLAKGVHSQGRRCQLPWRWRELNKK
jgi:endonuclease YncB( thermonuclease family)